LGSIPQINSSKRNADEYYFRLTESKGNPDTDPLLVWLSGGPGCSSFAALFLEHGPFYINFDGKTLYENKYSWNAKANFLFFESPIGVGFSYDTNRDSYSTANDDQTASQNFYALKDFFETWVY
ncbi:serine carboxypeptidase, partial [Ancylostoma duodenale]